jgi:hypothetical protein
MSYAHPPRRGRLGLRFYARRIETARCQHLSSCRFSRNLCWNSRLGSWRSSWHGFVRPRFHDGAGLHTSCKTMAVDNRRRNFRSLGASRRVFVFQAATRAITNLRIYSGLCHRDRWGLRWIGGKKGITGTFREVVLLWGWQGRGRGAS